MLYRASFNRNDLPTDQGVWDYKMACAHLLTEEMAKTSLAELSQVYSWSDVMISRERGEFLITAQFVSNLSLEELQAAFARATGEGLRGFMRIREISQRGLSGQTTRQGYLG